MSAQTASNKTGLVYDDKFLFHLCHAQEQKENIFGAQYHHPQVQTFLKQNEQQIEQRKCNVLCSMDDLLLCHSPNHVHFMESMSHKIVPQNVEQVEHYFATHPASESCEYQRASKVLDLDTMVCKHSYVCERLAIAGLIQLCHDVAVGQLANGVMLGSGGHHATRNGAQGLCIFNSEGIAVRWLLQNVPAMKKIAIVDWDVHHGNETEFYKNGNVLTISMHRSDGGGYYPASGFITDHGEHEGEGFNVNIPFGQEKKGGSGRGRGNADYRLAFDNIVKPILQSYQPDFIMVFSGWDALEGDPIGNMKCTGEVFAYMLHEMVAICPKIVMSSNHAYNAETAAKPFLSCVPVLLNKDAPVATKSEEPVHGETPKELLQVLQHYIHYWPCLKPGLAKMSHLTVQQAMQAKPAPARPTLEQTWLDIQALPSQDVKKYFAQAYQLLKKSLDKPKIPNALVLELYTKYCPLKLQQGTFYKLWLQFLQNSKLDLNGDDLQMFVDFDAQIAFDLHNFDPCDAWPVALDEFVQFLQFFQK